MPKTAVDPHFATTNEPITAARHAEAVTPSDTVDLSHVTSAIYVGVTGDLAMILANDPDVAPVTFKAVPAGTLLQLQCRRVMATGTTASSIVALWS
jgi:hypothetical protein